MVISGHIDPGAPGGGFAFAAWLDLPGGPLRIGFEGDRSEFERRFASAESFAGAYRKGEDPLFRRFFNDSTLDPGSVRVACTEEERASAASSGKAFPALRQEAGLAAWLEELAGCLSGEPEAGKGGGR